MSHSSVHANAKIIYIFLSCLSKVPYVLQGLTLLKEVRFPHLASGKGGEGVLAIHGKGGEKDGAGGVLAIHGKAEARGGGGSTRKYTVPVFCLHFISLAWQKNEYLKRYNFYIS